jgi:hypothetical protein
MAKKELLQEYVDTLGLPATDKVTGFQGVISSVSFDLYGCIQVALTPPIDKDGKLVDGRWFDVNRLHIGKGAEDQRKMPVPEYKALAKFQYGPAEKPGPVR